MMILSLLALYNYYNNIILDMEYEYLPIHHVNNLKFNL